MIGLRGILAEKIPQSQLVDLIQKYTSIACPSRCSLSGGHVKPTLAGVGSAVNEAMGTLRD